MKKYINITDIHISQGALDLLSAPQPNTLLWLTDLGRFLNEEGFTAESLSDRGESVRAVHMLCNALADYEYTRMDMCGLPFSVKGVGLTENDAIYFYYYDTSYGPAYVGLGKGDSNFVTGTNPSVMRRVSESLDSVRYEPGANMRERLKACDPFPPEADVTFEGGLVY